MTSQLQEVDADAAATTIDTPLIISPKLPMYKIQIAGISGVLWLFTIILPDDISKYAAFSSLCILLGAISHLMLLSRCRAVLTTKHLDIIAAEGGLSREILEWEDIQEFREVTIRWRWYLFWESGGYLLRTPTRTYRLSKASWLDGEWIVIYYRRQTGREVRQVNYW